MFIEAPRESALFPLDNPFEIGDVQMSSQPRFSVTKGALAWAMAEEKR